jgi:hypothetical protein
MGVQTLLLGMTLLWSLACGGGSQRAAGDESPPRRRDTADVVQAAVDLLRAEGAIDRLEVVHMPNDVESPVRVTPEALEKCYYFKMEFREFFVSQFREELASDLAASVLRSTAEEGDLRWGCIFYDEEGRRVLTMYFDSRGRFGSINGVLVTGGYQVVQALERRCSCLWAGQYDRW